MKMKDLIKEGKFTGMMYYDSFYDGKGYRHGDGRLKMKTNVRLREGQYEYNNLPDANSYHIVIKPFDIYIMTGSKHKGEYYGSSAIYRATFEKAKAKPGDQIHNLVGGLFYVPKSGKVAKMQMNPESDAGAFERRGREFNKFDLSKLQEIPKEEVKKVSYN